MKILDWISSLTDLWGSPLKEPLTGYDAHDTFYAKSVLVPESSPLTVSATIFATRSCIMLSVKQPAALTSYFSYIIANASHFPGFFEINLIGGPGSLINNPPAAALNSAYSGRGALWVVQNYASSSSPGIIPYVNGLNNAMEKEMPGTTFGGYLNYVDPELSAQEAHALYYSKEVYARLLGIKKAVDPGNVFSNPQGVGM